MSDAQATLPAKRLSDEGSTPVKKMVKLSASSSTKVAVASKLVKLSASSKSPASPKTPAAKSGEKKVVKLLNSNHKVVAVDGLDTTPEGM
jgi:hypothetical protein